MSYSDEAKKAAPANLNQLKELGQRQALDRKLRQMQVDLPETETEVHKGDVDGQIWSKITRLKTIIAELLAPDSTGRTIRRDEPELLEKLDALRKQVDDLEVKD